MSEHFTPVGASAHQEQSHDLEYAGFWIRCAAALIDTVLLLLITLPLLYLVYGAATDPTTMMRGPAEFLISWVFPAVATIWLWIAFRATPGKLAIGAKIVDAETGEAPSLSQYVIRYLAYFPSAIVLALGFVWVGFDRRKQGWHDKLARTVVVRRGGVEEVRFKPRSEASRVLQDPKF